MFGEFLDEVSGIVPDVLIIAGNHDSGASLGYCDGLLERSGVHIAGRFGGGMERVTVGDTDFWLLPFFRVSEVRAIADVPIDTYADAMAWILGRADIDPSRANVLVAHQFFIGRTPPETSDSEDQVPDVGGLSYIPADMLDAFDYVALGHLHSPQKVGRETLRYCGTPLKYSFSEAGQCKSATFVELGAKGEVHITTAPLTPRHELRGLRGSYTELTDRRCYEGTAVDDYLYITLTDEQDVPDALARLRVIYPNLMQLDYDNQRTRQQQEISAPERTESISPLEHLAAFYQLQNNQPLTAEQTAFCQELIEEIWKEGDTV